MGSLQHFQDTEDGISTVTRENKHNNTYHQAKENLRRRPMEGNPQLSDHDRIQATSRVFPYSMLGDIGDCVFHNSGDGGIVLLVPP